MVRSKVLPKFKGVREILTAVQDVSISKTEELLLAAHKLYQEVPFSDFEEDILFVLRYMLFIPDNEPNVRKITDFVSKFAIRLSSQEKSLLERSGSQESTEANVMPGEGDPRLFENIIQFCLQHCEARSKNVRFRCCELIGKLLNTMDDDASMNIDLSNRIYRKVTMRMKDICPQVRLYASVALQRLQDPSNGDCEVIREYLFSLRNDPCHLVRCKILEGLAANVQTLQAMIERTRDNSDLVRKIAIQQLSKKVHLKALTIQQRIDILTNGLNDNAGIVQQAVRQCLLPAWLQRVNGEVLDLLKRLDVESAPEMIEKALLVLLPSIGPLDQVVGHFAATYLNAIDDGNDKTVQPERLSSELAVYWRCLCQLVRNSGEADAGILQSDVDRYLDALLPSLPQFCFLIERIAYRLETSDESPEQMSIEFQLVQLCKMFDYFGLVDDFCRRRLVDLMRRLFSSLHVSKDCCEQVMPTVLLAHQSLSDDFCRFMLECISELQDACERLVQPTDSEASMPDVDKTGLDLKTTVKALTLAKLLYFHIKPNRKQLDGLHSLCEHLVIVSIQRPEAVIRLEGFKALGAAALVVKELAMQFFSLFMHVTIAGLEELAIRLVTFRIAIDILLQYGLTELVDAQRQQQTEPNAMKVENDLTQSSQLSSQQSFEIAKLTQSLLDTSDDQSSYAQKLVSILMRLLDNSSPEVVVTAVEGLTRLLYFARIQSSQLLSKLLILLFQPIDKKRSAVSAATHARVISHLLTFFDFFCYEKIDNQESVRVSLQPVLETILTSEMNYDWTRLMNSVLELTNPKRLRQPVADDMQCIVHVQLAHDLLTLLTKLEARDVNDKALNRAVCRSLLRVYFPKPPADTKMDGTLGQTILDAGALVSHLQQVWTDSDQLSCRLLKQFDQSILMPLTSSVDRSAILQLSHDTSRLIGQMGTVSISSTDESNERTLVADEPSDVADGTAAQPSLSRRRPLLSTMSSSLLGATPSPSIHGSSKRRRAGRTWAQLEMSGIGEEID